MIWTIRPAAESDVPRWSEMRAELWPGEPLDELAEEARTIVAAGPETVFVADAGGRLVGFLELSLRSYAEGCAGSPVPYVEAWFVDAEWRGRGVGAGLMAEAERWSRDHGFTELASDTEVSNSDSRRAHVATGFVEVETIVIFRKTL